MVHLNKDQQSSPTGLLGPFRIEVHLNKDQQSSQLYSMEYFPTGWFILTKISNHPQLGFLANARLDGFILTKISNHPQQRQRHG